MRTFIVVSVILLVSCYLTFAESTLIKLLPDHISSHATGVGPPEFRADRDEFPHQVALMVEHAPGQRELLCSGAVIHSHFVLAAAHCFDDVSPIAIIVVEAGEESNPQIRRASRITVHPEYKPFTPLDPWDVALVQLRVPLILGDAVRVIKLDCEAPKGDAIYTYWSTNTVANHGRQGLAAPAQRQLVYSTVSLLDEAECRARLHLLDLPLEPLPLCSSSGQTLSHAAPSAQKDSGGLLIQENGNQKSVIGFTWKDSLYVRIPWLCEWIYEIERAFHVEL